MGKIVIEKRSFGIQGIAWLIDKIGGNFGNGGNFFITRDVFEF